MFHEPVSGIRAAGARVDLERPQREAPGVQPFGLLEQGGADASVLESRVNIQLAKLAVGDLHHPHDSLGYSFL